ncbi:hypothetical protein Tco_0884570, partial [Tanacetum coccineum]
MVKSGDVENVRCGVEGEGIVTGILFEEKEYVVVPGCMIPLVGSHFNRSNSLRLFK